MIGAGPAGATLSLHLARAGFEVILADRHTFPRPKPCGEFLSPECLPILTELGLGSTLADLGAHRVAGMRISGYGLTAHGWFRQLPDRAAHGRVGFGIRRERFDHHLVQAAQRAGVEVLTKHAYESLRTAGDRVVGATLRAAERSVRVDARWVVGADGVHSRVARDLGLQRRIPWLDQFALVARFERAGVQPMADVLLLPGGFLAATTVDEGFLSVNLVLPRRLVKEKSAIGWDALLDEHSRRAPALRERLTGARRAGRWGGAGPFGYRTEAPWTRGAALVGDAAGYIDPLTGEGIYFALYGAHALGNALTAALRDPAREVAALRGYEDARHRELRPRMRASEILQRAIRHPWLVRAFLRSAGRFPTVADLIVTLSGDTVHPSELWCPTFWRAWSTSA